MMNRKSWMLWDPGHWAGRKTLLVLPGKRRRLLSSTPSMVLSVCYSVRVHVLHGYPCPATSVIFSHWSHIHLPVFLEGVSSAECKTQYGLFVNLSAIILPSHVQHITLGRQMICFQYQLRTCLKSARVLACLSRAPGGFLLTAYLIFHFAPRNGLDCREACNRCSVRSCFS